MSSDMKYIAHMTYHHRRKQAKNAFPCRMEVEEPIPGGGDQFGFGRRFLLGLELDDNSLGGVDNSLKNRNKFIYYPHSFQMKSCVTFSVLYHV